MHPATTRPRRAFDRALLASSSAIALLSCGNGDGSSKAPTTPDTARSRLVVRETGVGPIDGNVAVSVESVRALLPGYDVKGEPGFHLTSGDEPDPPDVHVSANGEKLLVIIPGERGTVLQVLVVSARVASQTRWHVGDKLTAPTPLAACECVRNGLTCFTKGSHVGLVLDDNCWDKLEDDALAGRQTLSHEYRRLENGEPAALATLNGRTVRMVIWKPRVFGSPRDAAPTPPD